MEGEPRRLRADAERNRSRLLAAASEMFRERGLDVGVGEIAERAEVGRGTLFRHFPTKEHLVKAILLARVQESIDRGRAALEAPDAGRALFELIDDAVIRSQQDRALWEALDDVWLNDEEIHAKHGEMLALLDRLLERAQQAGEVRPDVGAIDVLMMIKGVCEARQSLPHVSEEVVLRQVDLLRAALTPAPGQSSLRGNRPTLSDLERVVSKKRTAGGRAGEGRGTAERETGSVQPPSPASSPSASAA